MSHEEEWLELNNLYWAQAEHLELVEAKLLVLQGVEAYCTMLETLLRDYSEFAARLHTTSLSPDLWHERDALQARTWELLEGKERGR